MRSIIFVFTLILLNYSSGIYSQCPDGSPGVRCFADPCSLPAPSGCNPASCVSDYCGGCNRHFFDEQGKEICIEHNPYVQDDAGVSPGGCPPQPCDMACPFGYKLDENGCSLCECEESACKEVMCDLYCENGFEIDKYGCEICQCAKKAPECSAISCMMYCPYGFEKDENNCDICRCAKNPICAATMCAMIACENGVFIPDDPNACCPICLPNVQDGHESIRVKQELQMHGGKALKE